MAKVKTPKMQDIAPEVQQLAPKVAEQVLDAAGKPVSRNPAHIVFPTDVWGMTTGIKNELRALSGRVSGCPKKYQIVKDTLMIALEHLRLRYEEDNAKKNIRT